MVMMVNSISYVFYHTLKTVFKHLLNSLCENCIKINKHKSFAGVYIVIQTLHDVTRHVKAIQTSEHKHSAQIWRGSWIFTLPNRSKGECIWGWKEGRLSTQWFECSWSISQNTILTSWLIIHSKIIVLSFESWRIRTLCNSLWVSK